MSQPAVVVSELAIAVLLLLVLFVAAGTIRALALSGRRSGVGPDPTERVESLSRRRFLVRMGRKAAGAVGAVVGVGLVMEQRSFAQGQCTSCVYGVGDSCQNAYSEVVPGCQGQCPPRQGYQVCSQRCFAC